MYIVILRDGKPVDAFFRPDMEGYVELDYLNPIAKLLVHNSQKRS